MYCRHCGSPLSIEDAFCPFCGKENEAAKKHTAEMNRFSKEFNETKSAVVGETNRIKSYIPMIILIVLLAAANIAAIFVKENAYNFQYSKEKKEVSRNADQYRKILSEMEESGSYSEMACYVYNKNLFSTDKLREFALVADAAQEYNNFMQSFENILGRRSRDYRVDEFEASDWKRMGESLFNFWSYADGKKVYYAEFGTNEGSHKAAIEDMNNRISGLLISACGFSEEEVDGLKKTDAQKVTTEIRARLEEK